jgi:hypothetical protein
MPSYIFLLIALICVGYFWYKNKNKLYFYLLIFIGILFLLGVWQDFITPFLKLSGTALAINSDITNVCWILAVIALVVFIVKDFSKK